MDVFQYTDYRALVAAWLQERRGRPSLRTFAKRAGCSPALLSLVLSGGRDLDPARVSAFSGVMGLDEEEGAYFRDLVLCEHGSTLVDRRAARQRVLAVRRFRMGQRIRDPLGVLLSRWYLPAIVELSRCEGFRADPAWIAATLTPRITDLEAQEALDDLERIGVLARDASGALACVADYATPTEIDEDAVDRVVRDLHRWALRRGAEALDAFGGGERHLATFTVAIDGARLPEIKAAIMRFQMELAQLCEQSPGDRVYQMSMQLFPVTDPITES